MINKRLLIKNLLAHNGENSFYDNKLLINIGSKEGKAKFLKHVCSLSNTNPISNSYIVIGIEDESNKIVGVDFFDDSKIQNLVNAYLEHPPIVSYENIQFPHLPDDKVVGLVSIRPKRDQSICALRKNIWKYWGGTVFMREGSISKPKVFDIEIKDINSEIVAAIEQNSQNNIELTLDSFHDFLLNSKDFNPRYKVFKEYFVLCWAGKPKTVGDKTFYSRVNIQLINEQVKLFYSDLDEVEIQYDEDKFQIIEYVHLGLQNRFNYYPLEKVMIHFRDNMHYDIESKLMFEPPQFDQKTLRHYLNHNDSLLKKLKNKVALNSAEKRELVNLSTIYLIAYLNGFASSLEKLEEAKPLLKAAHPKAYQRLKDNLRILRKIKYN
ncbi:ATP-binding protein [Psychroflexus sp. MES1-P1E]|uniref:ATP-binding protein n=1 Tax=Psychroflexus sp. MES1-P1E TaxID=2058320 RepID=UPI000C7BCA96|nr:ATP-binding protein [Psychroflexus sp. MES1-P1E]PKG41318.1 AAA family ATPase [Psychroflexus sp. MES1-P1E]